MCMRTTWETTDRRYLQVLETFTGSGVTFAECGGHEQHHLKTALKTDLETALKTGSCTEQVLPAARAYSKGHHMHDLEGVLLVSRFDSTLRVPCGLAGSLRTGNFATLQAP